MDADLKRELVRSHFQIGDVSSSKKEGQYVTESRERYS
jgi:hypothetical protein